MSLTDSCIQLLYTEGLINEETQRKIERCGGSLSDSLRELMITVSEDHSKLRSLGDILLKLEETNSVAQEMIKDYGKNTLMMCYCKVIIIFLDNLLSKPICEPDTQDKSTAEAPLGTCMYDTN